MSTTLRVPDHGAMLTPTPKGKPITSVLQATGRFCGVTRDRLLAKGVRAPFVFMSRKNFLEILPQGRLFREQVHGEEWVSVTSSTGNVDLLTTQRPLSVA